MMDDIVKRLQEKWCGYYGMDETHPVNPDGEDAAAEIEALRRDNADLRAKLADAVEALEEVCAEKVGARPRALRTLARIQGEK